MNRIAMMVLRSGVGALASMALLSLLTSEYQLPVVLKVIAAEPDVEPLEPPAGQVFQTGGRMDSFAFHPEGKMLVTAGWVGPDNDQEAWKAGKYPGDLHLFDVVNGKEIAHLDEECGALFDVAFSPDGRALATAGRVLGSPNLGEVRIWNVTLRKTLITIRSQNSWALAISYSPDGMFLASGGFDRMVRVWDARTAKEIAVLPQPSTPSSLSFSADGKTLVAGCRGGTAVLWNLPTWKEQGTFEDKNMFLLGAAVSSDGRFLAAGGPPLADGGRIDARTEGALRTGDLKTAKEHRVWKVEGHPSGVAFSPDGRYVAAAHRESSVWDVETGDKVALIRRSNSSSSDQIHFSPDGKTLAIGASNRVQSWDISSLWEEKKAPD